MKSELKWRILQIIALNAAETKITNILRISLISCTYLSNVFYFLIPKMTKTKRLTEMSSNEHYKIYYYKNNNQVFNKEFTELWEPTNISNVTSSPQW